MAGYHFNTIIKGKLGEASKIREEYEEFADAIKQENPVLALCEIADLLGAIDLYTQKKHNLSLLEVFKMSRATQRAFEEGERS